VGRLDAQTEGLLLLTNDGELANRLMHPSYEVSKTYMATVLGEAKKGLVHELKKGIELDDGIAKADDVQIVDVWQGKSLIKLELHEGRKHIVRRLLKAAGFPVQALVRTKIHTVQLGDQKPGSVRALNRSELTSRYKAVGLSAGRTGRMTTDMNSDFSQLALIDNLEEGGFLLAIDGPSGTGKSTVSRRIAQYAGARYLDTGAMYRVATLHVLKAGIDPADPAASEAIIEATSQLPLQVNEDPQSTEVLLDGEDVSADIRGPEVTAHVSAVAAIPEVRTNLVELQRDLAAAAG